MVFSHLLLKRGKFQKLLNYNIKREMHITPIPANEDNYMYLVVDEQSKKAAIVDPVNIDSVLNTAKSQGVELTHALDHAGGTGKLKKAMNGVKIYGGDGNRIEAIDVVLEDEQNFNLGSLKITALKTPCHTSTHICYFVEDEANNKRAVFTGDTLFIGGCGRFFEGTAEQMHFALNSKLANLPDDTLVYCGHEYTVKNLQFAATIEPQNEEIKKKLSWANDLRAAGLFTVPSTMGEEKTFNPFMRVESADIQRKLGTSDLISTMQKLREMKNAF